ncbi:hypothetical protein EVA_06317 [gut metagenome]|uniref:Uncharacterized protein n=1 Tax=gut metagenome TaxID=749906 RepID=J9GF90_9ZZZZ
MREVEDHYVVAPYLPEPRQPVDFRLLQLKRPMQVE